MSTSEIPLEDVPRQQRATSVRSHDSRSTHSHREDRDRDSDRRRSDRSEREREIEAARRRRRDSRTPDYSDRKRNSRAGGDDRPRSDRGDGERRDRDDYRDSKRRRSRSRSRERYDDRSRRDYDRGHYRERDDRRRDDYRPRHRGSPSYDSYSRDSRDPPPRRERSPELSEEQREMRSVFVSQLSARVGDRELALFFESQAGKVRDARVIVDRISRRSKGVGYVEFVDLETVQKALTLSNTKLLGIPIIVQYTEAEKNRQARDGPSSSGGPSGPANGLYVGSLNFALTENDIRQVFQPFGEVEVVDLHKDPVTGKSKGYAFVQFKEAKDAHSALEKMNNFSLAGREIKVGLVADKSVAFSRQEAQLEEGNGTALNNISRIELMQKLARTDRPPIDLPKAPLFRPNIPLATTRNVLMKDAFNPEEETERDWDLELRDDVKGECEDKYGKVAEIFVVKESQGEIYIRFETVDSAISAVAGLNGRWFGGRQISAAHVNDSLFDAKK
ncbi:hypothetical protein BCR35DRAFT_353072 [Leucosporidium creatinivorum]|uniref:RRM domain-containing protein n=1 Tax=Leucosporidium creatinivorum TaxID=106004 RepID=A0A1Y2F2M1_9BASI|nr:hypothetical protein BCR35DRAFT_353072 [Leucosporidium creatinivorum]